MTHPDPDPLLLNHNYDGIQELDNPLPRWWIMLFYLCIAFAGGYFTYYTFLGGPTLGEELDQSLEKSKPKVSNVVSSTDFKPILHDDKTRSAGKVIFDAKCVACHNPQGEGLVGPNLTDAYWIHGKGTVTDIYQVIRDGVPDKGMLTWGPLLKPEELKAVAVYVYSLRGTHPSNPKAPQGEKYELESE